jgi:hypothetical protein
VYLVDGLQEIPLACTHTPEVFDPRLRSIRRDLLDSDGAIDSTLTPQQETLCSLANHSYQVASQPQPG